MKPADVGRGIIHLTFKPKRPPITNVVLLAAAVTLYALVGSAPALAQCELAKLLASDGATGDEFGYSVLAAGDVAVIGAIYDDEKGSDSGSAYIFERNGSSWVQVQKLVPADGVAGAYFGYEVAISSDTLMIGVPWDDDNGQNSGSVYVYRHDGSNWVQVQKLTASDGAPVDAFGCHVAIEGDFAIISASRDDDLGEESGSAYVFQYNGSTWVQVQKLLPSDGTTGDRFATCVDLSGGVAAIGAYKHDEGNEDTGAVYVYRHNGSSWDEEAQLHGSNTDYGYFGKRVAIEDDLIVVGVGNDPAGAHVFRYNPSPPAGWVKETAFGHTFSNMAISSGQIVVQKENPPLFEMANAYLYRHNGSTWIQEVVLQPCDFLYSAPNSWGFAVAISGDTILFAVSREDQLGDDAGAVYVFSLADCNGNGVCDITDIANGTSSDDDNNGIPDECEVDSDGDGVFDYLDACPNTIPSAPVDANGCPPVIPGDFDRDGDVDQDDLAAFVSCSSGPTIPYTGDCADKDFNSDNDVDQSDFGLFQRCLSGEDIPADPTCQN